MGIFHLDTNRHNRSVFVIYKTKKTEGHLCRFVLLNKR